MLALLVSCMTAVIVPVVSSVCSPVNPRMLSSEVNFAIDVC
jgi:hypothetical protein